MILEQTGFEQETVAMSSGSDADSIAFEMLRPCMGGCGQKILFFGFPENKEDWGSQVEGTLCLECRSKPLKHIPR